MQLVKVITLTMLLLFANLALAGQAAPTKKLDPIFSAGTSKYDHIGPAADISSYDQSILDTCGNWGSQVYAGDLLKMFSDEKNRPVMTKIFDSLNKKVLGSKALTFEDFNKELSVFLAMNQGFSHVFCGLSRHGTKSTVGLHYFARILELQDKNIIGRDTNPSANSNKTIGQEHTLGVEYVVPGTTQIAKQPAISFVNGLHGDDMIVEIVKAARKVSSAPGKRVGPRAKTSCYHCMTTSDNSRVCFNTIIVGNNTLAITSFYPDTAGCPARSCNLC